MRNAKANFHTYQLDRPFVLFSAPWHTLFLNNPVLNYSKAGGTYSSFRVQAEVDQLAYNPIAIGKLLE